MIVETVTHNGSHATYPQAALILGTTSPLLLISSTLFLLQLFLRLKSIYHGRYYIGWDDGFLILGMLFNITAFASLLVAIIHGLDSRVTTLSQKKLNDISLWISVARPLWIWSSVWAKMSLAITIMRVKVSPLSRALMTAFIAVVPVLVFAIWLPTVIHRHARPSVEEQKINDGLYLGVALVFLLANIVLTLPPALFLFSRRPLGERIIASFLCFLGLCAFACSVGRVVLQVQTYSHTVRQITFSVATGGTLVPYIILASVETSVSIIAACTPTFFHYAAKLKHLVPTSYRERLNRKKSTLRSRRDTKTPEIRSSEHRSSGFLDRWSRDLGLDALPDNPRFSTNPRMRVSWLAWRNSFIGANANRNTLGSTQEAVNEESESAVDLNQPVSPNPMARVRYKAAGRDANRSQTSIHASNPKGRPAPIYSKSANRWSIWAPMRPPTEAPTTHRRRSSTLSAWLQWEKAPGERKSIPEQSPKVEDARIEGVRSYTDQPHITSFDEPSEKSNAVSSPDARSGHSHSQTMSLESCHKERMSDMMSREEDTATLPRTSSNFDSALDAQSPTNETSTSHPDFEKPDEEKHGERPLSWESAQHQYFEPQLSASLEAPPGFMWGTMDDRTAGDRIGETFDEEPEHWAPTDRRRSSFRAGDDGAAPDPPVLTIRNL